MDALTEALRTAHSPNADEAVRAYALRVSLSTPFLPLSRAYVSFCPA